MANFLFFLPARSNKQLFLSLATMLHTSSCMMYILFHPPLSLLLGRRRPLCTLLLSVFDLHSSASFFHLPTTLNCAHLVAHKAQHDCGPNPMMMIASATHSPQEKSVIATPSQSVSTWQAAPTPTDWLATLGPPSPSCHDLTRRGTHNTSLQYRLTRFMC